jgi:hypothetical protein
MTPPTSSDGQPPERADTPQGDADSSPGTEEGGVPEVTRPIPVRAPRPAGDEGSAEAAVPKPVRAGLEPESPPPAAAMAEVVEVSLELDQETLAVRVRGRARGSTSQGAADLLLLGFHREGEEEPVREAMVVARRLEDLSPLQLEEAWNEGREPRDPNAPSELFPETSRNRGRGR